MAVLSSVAYASALTAQVGEVRFNRVSVEEGLSHSTVWTIHQDRRGFLWIGTQAGLDRYDGYEFVTYRNDPEDPRSLSESEVDAVLEDSAGNLWLGTIDGGLERFRRVDESFEHYVHDPADSRSLSNDTVTKIFEDRGGALWVGTLNGLNRLRPDGTFDRYLTPSSEAEPEVMIQELHQDRSGRLWVATSRGLAESASGSSFSWHEGLAGAGDVWAIAEDAEGRLWVSATTGLWVLDLESGISTRGEDLIPTLRTLEEASVLKLHVDRQGELWLGTETRGLYRYRPAAGTLENYRHDPYDPHSLSNDSVLAIHEDRTGILWFASYVGLNKYDRRRDQFSIYRQSPGRDQSLSSSSIWAILEDRAGVLWVGTYDSGLNRIDREQGTIRHYEPDPEDPGSLPNGAVSALVEDRQGELWVGTWSGLSRFDRERQRFVTYRHQSGDGESGRDAIQCLHEDSRGRFWVGTFEGLHRFNRPSRSFVSYPTAPADPPALAEAAFYSIAEDPTNGAVWFGSEDVGLYRLDPESDRFTHFEHDPADPESLTSNKVAHVFVDRSGTLWVGTYGGGLDRLDPGSRRFRHYREKDGLASDIVVGILEDDAGDLWISTAGGGLSRLDPRLETFQNYDTEDGLEGNVFSTGSAFKSPSGELYFGGIHGLNVFRPEEIEINPHPPQVEITDFLLFNRSAPLRRGEIASPLERSILETDELELSHRDYVFAFEFAALHFANPSKNRYAYRLEGFDRDWVRTDAQKRFAQYSNLKPGRYVFRVKASNADGVWNDEGASLRVTVLPPPWRSWWAYALYAFLAAGMATALVRQQRDKLDRERAVSERERAIAAERARLIEELEAKNDELERFTYTVSHDLKSPLVTINGFVALLEQDLKRGENERVASDLQRIRTAAAHMELLLEDLLQLSRVGRQTNPPEDIALGELIEEVLELVSGQLVERGVEVEVEPDMPVVRGDRSRLRQVFQNLLDNAVKFLGDEPRPRIEIGTRREPGELRVFVKDNGIGVDEAYQEKIFGLFERLDPSREGTGIGLALARRILEVHGGRLWVESAGHGRGSTFFAAFPENAVLGHEASAQKKRGA